MICFYLCCNSKLSIEKCSTKLGNQFFLGISKLCISHLYRFIESKRL